MSRKTIKIELVCSKCNKNYHILQWQLNQKIRRSTKKNFCSSKCKNDVQRLGGKFSGTWKGGRRSYPSQGGYIMLRVGPNKRIFEHRFFMEQKIGRKLKKGEVIHHIDGNPSNNNIKNLVLCKSAGYHTSKYHSRGTKIRKMFK